MINLVRGLWLLSSPYFMMGFSLQAKLRDIYRERVVDWFYKTGIIYQNSGDEK